MKQVLCLNAETGEEIWRYSEKGGFYEPMATPCIDGGMVYALTDDGILLGLKANNGNLKWRKDLVSEYDAVEPFYKFAASPVAERDLLLLTVNSSGLALDKRRGKKIWGSDKPPKRGDIEALWDRHTTGTDYTTPVVYIQNGTRFALLTSYAGVHSVQVETGEVQWVVAWDLYSGCYTADALVFNDTVFVTQYDELGCFLLDIGGVEPRVLWKNHNLSSDVASPVLVDGYIYGCEGGPEVGFCSLRCLDVGTGEVMWEEDFGNKYGRRNISS